MIKPPLSKEELKLALIRKRFNRLLMAWFFVFSTIGLLIYRMFNWEMNLHYIAACTLVVTVYCLVRVFIYEKAIEYVDSGDYHL